MNDDEKMSSSLHADQPAVNISEIRLSPTQTRRYDLCDFLWRVKTAALIVK